MSADAPRDGADSPAPGRNEHLPLSVPVYQILLSLTDRPLHGYAMIQDIARRTRGEVDLTASTLYGAVRRLLDEGLIEESEERPDPRIDDSRRRYYALTAVGREALAAEARRLHRALEQARARGVEVPGGGGGVPETPA